jgi:hypothetical protein
MRIRLACLAFLVLLCSAASAQDIAIHPADNTQSVLSGQKGKRVTVRIRSGQELTGVVREVNEKLVVLGVLGGREYFDAVVSLDAVEAVMIRTGKQ